MSELSDEEIDAIFDAEIEAVLDEDVWHTALMHRTDTPETEGAPGCWFGGEPTLPTSTPWPTRIWESQIDGKPISIEYPLLFLMQIDCRELPYLEGEPDNIPREGFFFVFFDPINLGLQHGVIEETARLIYVEQDCSKIAPRQCPPMPEMPAEKVSHQYHGETEYRHWPFTFIPTTCFRIRHSIIEGLDDDEGDEVWGKYTKRMRQREAEYAEQLPILYNLHNYWLREPFDQDGTDRFRLFYILSDQGKTDKPIGFEFGDLNALIIGIHGDDLRSRNFQNYYVKAG